MKTNKNSESHKMNKNRESHENEKKNVKKP